MVFDCSKMFGRVIFPLIMILLAVCLFSCSSGPKPTARLEDVIAMSGGSQGEAKEFNERLLTMVGPPPQLADYPISEGDLLQVTVFEADELKREVRVGDRGAIMLPLLGSVEVKGLTTLEAAEKVEQAYRKKYLQDPHVDIFVKEYQGGKITLLGQFKNPGTYNYFGRQRLLDVLALGQGLTEKAGRTVQVRRVETDARRPNTYLIDLDEIVVGGQAELNIPILRGDTVYVPNMGMVFVDGAVKNPGTYGVTPSMTVQESIVQAGGYSVVADTANIKLVRKLEGGKREVVQLSNKDLRSDSGHDLQIKDRDIVFVESSFGKQMIYGLKLNFFTGLVGVGYESPRER
jgi:polysaccharide biosynthesis/export protein